MYGEIHSYADTHNDSTITLDFMSYTDTYNRDNKHIMVFHISQVKRGEADDLIKRLVQLREKL